jgi:hypothetical protein
MPALTFNRSVIWVNVNGLLTTAAALLRNALKVVGFHVFWLRSSATSAVYVRGLELTTAIERCTPAAIFTSVTGRALSGIRSIDAAPLALLVTDVTLTHSHCQE